ncbi:hypothetical protein F5J12DRAFT_787391 [Pisolithus orientalis]|uniref:uncharacterized protein n=1 Tax=Pisolithus orientalis TaxID=936130 RepID=UPI00222410D2|nr:uncharacterized protein F5J12DRAFT_787391 [Pisolithus orientalis]KAI5985431.1 hypothetical protein F5J12DRAFT_787391 [Pisolithus orientalis]
MADNGEHCLAKYRLGEVRWSCTNLLYTIRVRACQISTTVDGLTDIGEGGQDMMNNGYHHPAKYRQGEAFPTWKSPPDIGCGDMLNNDEHGLATCRLGEVGKHMVQQSIYSRKSGGHAETNQCSIAFNTLDSLPDHLTGGINGNGAEQYLSGHGVFMPWTWYIYKIDYYYLSSLGFIHNLKALLEKDRHVRLAPGGSEGSIWPCQVTHADNKVIVELPHHYYKPIQAFTWREKVIWLVLHFKKEVEVEELLVENLTMILAYMNRVFIQVVAEVKKNILCGAMNQPSISEVDWVHREHALDEMWYGSWTQFEMDEKMKTVDVAQKLIDVMVDFNDPVEDEDPDFGYTYKEHLQGSTADKGKGKVQGEGDDSIGGGHCGGGIRCWCNPEATATCVVHYLKFGSLGVCHAIDKEKLLSLCGPMDDPLAIEMGLQMRGENEIPEETMVKVTSTNLYLKITEDHAQSKLYANFRPTLLRNIVHLDNIIEALIHPSIGMKEEDIPTHHCPNFEEFLSSEMDWDHYADWIPECFFGGEYDWEVDSVPDEDLPKMWDKVAEWYSQELDPHWISQWVVWDEGLGFKDEEKGTDDGRLDGDIDQQNMSDVDQDMEHGDDTNPEISGREDHGGEGGNGGKGCDENEEEDSEGSNDMGKNDGCGEQDSDLAVTQKQQLSEGSDEEQGGQQKRPSPNPPAAHPDWEGDQPIGFTHWSLPLDSDMIESQVDFPLDSFSQGASIVNEGLDPTLFPVAVGDDKITTHADDPPVNQQSGREPGGRQKGKGVATTKEFVTTQLLQSQKSSGTPQTELAHNFDMINMTVSPRKCTIARTLPEGMWEVSPMPGPSNINQPLMSTNTQTQITLDSKEVATFLKTIPGVVQSLAKGCKDREEGINEQFKQFFLNLRAISKVHGQKVSDVFSHLKATNEMHMQHTWVCIFRRWKGMKDTVIDINVKKGYLILANQSGLGMKKNA